jgi:hypothetical protein
MDFGHLKNEKNKIIVHPFPCGRNQQMAFNDLVPC